MSRDYSLGFRAIDSEEAQARFDLRSVDTIGRTHHDLILVHDGDLHLDALTDHWLVETLLGGRRDTNQELLVIDGALVVSGLVSLGGWRSFPSLIVRGDLRCAVFDMQGNLVQIDGDVTIERLYHGHAGQGQLRVGGVARVPLLLVGDHPVWFDRLAPGMVSINYAADDAEWFDFDYYRSDLPRICDPALLPEDADLSREVDAYNFGARFVERVRSGGSPFRPGLDIGPPD